MIYAYIINIDHNVVAHLITYLKVNEMARSIVITNLDGPYCTVTVNSSMDYAKFVNMIDELDYSITINKHRSKWCATPREALKDFEQQAGKVTWQDEKDYRDNLEEDYDDVDWSEFNEYLRDYPGL